MGFKAPRAARWLLGAAWAARTMLASEARAASLQAHAAVRGEAIEVAEIRSEGGRWRTVAWSDLAGTAIEPGRYEVRVRTSGAGGDEALEIPVCAGRDRVTLDARAVRVPDAGPVVLTLTPGAHDARIAVAVGRYERRIPCGDPVRVGAATTTLSADASGVAEPAHTSATTRRWRTC